jgi:hypothetical protein
VCQDIKQAMLGAARRKPVLLDRMLAQAMIPTMAQTGSRVDDILKMKFHLMATAVYKTDYGDMELVSLRTDTAKANKGRCSGGQQHQLVQWSRRCHMSSGMADAGYLVPAAAPS